MSRPNIISGRTKSCYCCVAAFVTGTEPRTGCSIKLFVSPVLNAALDEDLRLEVDVGKRQAQNLLPPPPRDALPTQPAQPDENPVEHRGAAFALSNASERARTRSIGSRSRGSLFIGSRSRGSLFIFRSSPAVAPPFASSPPQSKSVPHRTTVSARGKLNAKCQMTCQAAASAARQAGRLALRTVHDAGRG